MTQKKSSKEDEVEVKVEGEELPVVEEATPEAPKVDDAAALREQISKLKEAQDLARTRAEEAERQSQMMAQQLNTVRQSAAQSQLDSLTTAIGAAQVEVDAAKRDIILSGQAQDYGMLADAQERLSAAKAHMVSLEQGKQNLEAQNAAVNVDNNPNLMDTERSWLRSHPEMLMEHKKNDLDRAYFKAMGEGLRRGTSEYFNFLEEQLGYRQKPEPKEEMQHRREEESSVMVAAPPSKSVPTGSGTGGDGRKYTITKDEAEIARLSGITPAEYIKQKLRMIEEKQKGNLQS